MPLNGKTLIRFSAKIRFDHHGEVAGLAQINQNMVNHGTGHIVGKERHRGNKGLMQQVSESAEMCRGQDVADLLQC